MAATLLDVLAVTRAGGANAADFKFNVAGSASSYVYNNGPVTTTVTALTTRVACIRVP